MTTRKQSRPKAKKRLQAMRKTRARAKAQPAPHRSSNLEMRIMAKMAFLDMDGKT